MKEVWNPEPKNKCTNKDSSDYNCDNCKCNIKTESQLESDAKHLNDLVNAARGIINNPSK